MPSCPPPLRFGPFPLTPPGDLAGLGDASKPAPLREPLWSLSRSWIVLALPPRSPSLALPVVRSRPAQRHPPPDPARRGAVDPTLSTEGGGNGWILNGRHGGLGYATRGRSRCRAGTGRRVAASPVALTIADCRAARAGHNQESSITRNE